MTCIVGIQGKDGVFIGADSAGVAGLNLRTRSDAKVFQRGPFLIGFTSSFRMGQILRYRLATPDHPTDMPVAEFMSTRFVDAVRSCLRENGYLSKSNDVESAGTFLVGYRGRLFRIEDDLQVGEHAFPYDAVGCGENYAIGALSVLGLQDPRAAIVTALETAQNFSAGVRGPFHVLGPSA